MRRKPDKRLNHFPCPILARLVLLIPVLLIQVTPVNARTTPKVPAAEQACNRLGSLSKFFAEARNKRIPFWRARRMIRPMLTHNKMENRNAANRLLDFPGGLAYGLKDLKPITLFALTRELCLHGIRKRANTETWQYLVKSARLCQQRMQDDKGIYACMNLASRLYRQRKQ